MNENAFSYTYSAACNQEVLVDIAQTGATILISSHVLGELEKVATHYGIICHAKMIREMTAAELEASCRTYVALQTKKLSQAKALLMAVFVPIFLIMAVIAKNRAWVSILLSMMVGMFLFMMIPMLSPLDANLIHVIGCCAGGVLFGIGLGAISNQILKKPVWYNERQCRFYLDLEAALFL